MATPTQLTLYNGALRVLGERRLASLTENREPRYLLDDVWAEGAVDYCLARGQWYFAMKSAQLDYDTSVTPAFGYLRAFQKPTDWRLTNALCSDERYKVPLLDYIDEAAYWYADLDTLYVKYVSNDSLYGGDWSLWSEQFTEYVHAYLARKIARSLCGGDETKLEEIRNHEKECLTIAKNESAMVGPTRFPAQGSWSSARQSQSRRRDGGNTGSLIG